MLEIVKSVKEGWQSYGIETVNMALYWLALAWFWLYDKDRRKKNIYLYAMFAAALVTVGLASGWGSSRKLFYLLPAAVLAAYVGVSVAGKFFSEKKKWIIIVLYVIIIQAGTGWRFTDAYAFSNYNDTKISATVMRMADLIESVEAIEDPFLLAPEEIASQIQEYDVHIRVAYGEGYSYTEDDRSQLLTEMETYGCNFIIIKHIYDDEVEMKRLGYRQISIFDGYSVYYRI